MKRLLLALALAATLAAPSAFAADRSVDLSSGFGSFLENTPGTVLDGGSDVITFTGLAAGSYDFVLSVSSQYIPNLTGSLNGQAAIVSNPTADVVNLSLNSTGTSPFVLTLFGTPSSGPGITPMFSGEMSVTAVPEPATLALMLGGLGVIGFVALRCKPA